MHKELQDGFSLLFPHIPSLKKRKERRITPPPPPPKKNMTTEAGFFHYNFKIMQKQSVLQSISLTWAFYKRTLFHCFVQVFS